jgi:hypothetical protein
VLDSILQGILLLASVLTVFRLYTTGLYRRYPFFSLYFAFRVPNSVWPLLLDVRSNRYLHFWVLTEPVVSAFYVLMVFELYRLVLENYKGLYTLGRWAMYSFSAISLSISAVTLLPRIKPTAPQQSRIMGYVIAGERGIDFSLAIFLLLLLLFMALFPVKLSRNVRVHAALYTIFFLSNTLKMLLHSVFGMRQAEYFNTLYAAVSAATVIAWLVLLSPTGEQAPVAAALVTEDYEARALRGMEALNASMLRVSRTR